MNSEINYKKRVLFIVTQSEMGGAQKFLLNFLNKTRNEIEASVAFGADGDGDLPVKLANMDIETHRLRFLKREMSPGNDFRACLEIRKLIKKTSPNDIFLISSKAGFLGSFVSRYMIHDTRYRVLYRIGGWTFNDPWPNWKKRLWIILERISARWKDVIIVNSIHDLEQAKKLKIKPKEKLIMIHNGIDSYKISLMPKDEARIKLFERVLSKNGKVFQANTVIGTVGNFYPTKGTLNFIEAAEYFKNDERIIFIIVGDGKEKENIEKSIKNRGLEKKVLLAGRIDSQNLMTAFDIFVLPSLKEGFPWVLLEAMVAKVPVIATRVGAVPEIIDDGESGFIVEPGNVPRMVDKIRELIASDHLKKEFSIKGHQKVLFNFTEDKMINETFSLL